MKNTRLKKQDVLNTLFSEVARHSEDCIVLCDQHRNIKFVNSAALEKTGFKAGELVGKNISMLYAPRSRARYTSGITKALREKKKWSGELELRRSGNARLWVEATMSAVSFVREEPPSVLFVAHDLTERHRFMDRMWQEETESWRIINSMIEAVYLIDEKGKILTCNHGLVALTGYTRNEIVGIYPPYPWQTPLESRKYEQMLRQVAKSRSVNNVGLSWKKKDETRVLTNLTISPLQPFTKKLPRYVVIARDVSQHDHMEELSRAGARIQWLISDLRRKTATLETLIEIHQLLLLNAPLQKIFRQIMIGVRKLVAHDLSGIYLIDEKRKTLSPCVLSTKNAFSRSLVSSSLPLGRGIVGTAAATGRMSLVNNAQMDPRSIYPTRKKPYLEHVIAVPLCLGDMVFGVLAMARNRNPGFIEDEAILVRSLADAATLALEKARSFSQHANNQQEIFGIPIPPSESSGQFMDIFVHGNGNRKRQSRVEKLAQC